MTRVFLTTTSYGVMAGSLTGLASLAFYKVPGDHMKNVAVGASLGLYSGILLGVYMIYLVPDPSRPRRQEPEEFDLEGRLEPSPEEPRFVPYLAEVKPGAFGPGLLVRF